MATRLKATLPLAITIGVLAFVWTEVVLNFTFHWFTVSDHVFGQFGLPKSFYLILPASFVGWGLFFLLGADRRALLKTLVATVTGGLAAFALMGLSPHTAAAPKFWGIALWVLITAMALVLLSTVTDSDVFSAAPAFVCYASVFFWWNATGLDNFVGGGKGPHSVAALTAAVTTKPLAAGTGAFGGLISTPWPWVAVDVAVSIACGAVLGLASIRLSALLTRTASAQPAAQDSSSGLATGV
jgi:hypothetical protein